MNHSRQIAASFTFFLLMLLLYSRSGAALYHGIVVDSTKAGAPIAGVLVATGYGLDRTVTDTAGRFSLEIHENAVIPRRVGHVSPAITIIWNMRQGFFDVSSASEIRSIAICRLNGTRIWGAQCDNGKRMLRTPSMASGVCLLKCTRSDNTFFVWRSIQGIDPGKYRITIPSHRHHTPGAAAAVGSRTVLMFRHDGYYPVDRQVIASPGIDQIVPMHPDPRGIFFDESVVHTCSFTVAYDDSVVMERDAVAEAYVPAELFFDGSLFGKVGLRYKGSEYSLDRCFGENGNRSNYDDCRNVSLKIKCNAFIDTARLYGMKRLNLQSMSYDNSKMREPLAYGLFRECGIPAPRTVFVKVVVNGVSRGIFAAVEEIDGRFTKSRWPEYGDGNLYKEVWPIYKNKAKYRSALITNDNPEDSADVSRMVEFCEAIRASTPATFATMIAPFFDLDYWLRFIVVDRAIHNGDGVMTWYSDGNWLSNHNYCFYEDEAPGGKFWLIPWDMNATFSKTDPIFDDHDVPEWNVTPENCDPVEVWGGSFAVPPNCDPLTKLTAATSWGRFVTLGEQFLATVFTPERMNTRIDRLVKVIDPFMADDPFVDHATWRNQIDWLHGTMRILHEGFDDYLHGREVNEDTTGYFMRFPDDSGFCVSRVNNFEAGPEADISSWARAFISDNSSVKLVLDTVAPLWGTADISCSFVFNPSDTTTAYSEWLVTEFDFKRETDCSRLRELQCNLQCDVPRNVRIALLSDVYKRNDIDEGEEYCWIVSTGKKAKHVSLAIDAIDYPEWVKHARPELLDSVLISLRGISLCPDPRYDNRGELATVPDSGFLKIDNIRFVLSQD